MREGWPTRLTEDQVSLKSFFDRRSKLSIEQDCILWGARVIVPEQLQEDVMKMLHIYFIKVS